MGRLQSLGHCSCGAGNTGAAGACLGRAVRAERHRKELCAFTHLRTALGEEQLSRPQQSRLVRGASPLHQAAHPPPPPPPPPRLPPLCTRANAHQHAPFLPACASGAGGHCGTAGAGARPHRPHQAEHGGGGGPHAGVAAGGCWGWVAGCWRAVRCCHRPLAAAGVLGSQQQHTLRARGRCFLQGDQLLQLLSPLACLSHNRVPPTPFCSTPILTCHSALVARSPLHATLALATSTDPASPHLLALQEHERSMKRQRTEVESLE